MKKPLILFLIAIFVLIIAKLVYMKYCESKNVDCKEEKFDESLLPNDHMDY